MNDDNKKDNLGNFSLNGKIIPIDAKDFLAMLSGADIEEDNDDADENAVDVTNLLILVAGLKGKIIFDFT